MALNPPVSRAGYEEGLKSAWLAIAPSVPGGMQTATGCNEIQNATPEEMIYHHMVRDPIEVFIKDEAHTPQKCSNKKWRLIWSLFI